MEETKNTELIYSGRLIAKNTVYNILGYGIPLVVAVIFIPFLIKGLGEEKFGILSLAWVIIGYFSFLDFGIGKALTKMISEKISFNKFHEIPQIFWTSFLLMLFISLLGAILILIFTKTIVYDIFNISKPLQRETLYAIYILALSVPIVTTTTGIRGLLESYQKFGKINIIRVFLGISMFIVPLLCITFTNNLAWIMIFLVVVRIIVWLLYLFHAFKVNADLKKKIFFESKLVKPILKLGGWMTISNITAPIIVYMDRFLVGALISATAIAYYTTPYEVISKFLVIPSAITGVLFPTFSANYSQDPQFAKKVAFRAIKYVFILLFPLMLIMLSFAHEGLNLWLGKNFEQNSSTILQLLAAGILFNSLAYIPFSFLEGIGRPDITAKIQLIELPIYVLTMWFFIRKFGIDGAALVCFLRMLFDSIVLLYFGQKKLKFIATEDLRFKHISLFLSIIFPFFLLLLDNVLIKVVFLSLYFTFFAYVVWNNFLEDAEKKFILLRIKSIY